MVDIDRSNKKLQLAPLSDEQGQQVAPARAISYDTLVVAIGSTANDFGTQGARDNCIFLDSRPQADRFQQQFLNMYLQAHALPADVSPPPELNVAIIGAGATGVELAAELHHACHEFVRYGLDDIAPQNVNITLIEAADRVLPVLPPEVSAAAEAQLTAKGIKVLTKTKVLSIQAHHIDCDGGKQIAADLKVWSAGIKAPDFLQGIAGLESNRINQLVVKPSLQTTLDDAIFAFGDCASCTLPHMERPVPPRAQSAQQQANYLVKALTAHIQNKPLPVYKYSDFGSLISLSHGSSVGNLVGNIHVKGRIARLMYVMLYRMHQYSLHGAVKTFLLWAKDQLSKNASPTLKLH